MNKYVAVLLALTLAGCGGATSSLTGSRPDQGTSVKPIVVQACEKNNVSVNAPVNATQNCDKSSGKITDSNKDNVEDNSAADSHNDSHNVPAAK